MDPTVTSTETESVISSTGKIIEEECLTSKIVEDEGSIPFESYENPIKNIDYKANMQTSYDKNMKILMLIIDAVPMWARQRIVHRTHGENLENPFVRYTNFIAFLKGFANRDDALKNHLKTNQKCKNVLRENSEWNHY